ncbi:UDP-glucose:glycoprotein glucosyltransferase [Orchesella cincta]|uniref:UDP-glucose:glycoprotein glucosyltransferase n=1 Tax=Orchesella cincta TaxID=48709 RepID=A0A1D2N071_ORCCI|nr:UDP-glucose:glycoprotein glucosyltransferase [Orchesella cincta]
MVLAALASNDIDKLKKLLEEYPDDRTNTDGEIDPISANFMSLAGVPVGGKGLVVNGRIIGPLDEEDSFEVGDWALVEKFSYDSCAKYFDGEDRDADAVMRMCSALGNPNTKTKSSKRFTMPDFQKPHVVDTKRDLEDVFYVDLVAVVDPASRSGHKMAAFMAALKQAVGQWMKIQILFNTPPKNSELPLKSYFRFLAGQHAEEEIVFENIPREPLFTMNMIAPDNWMVEIKRGMSDLDNIRLNDLGHSVESEYELEYILVEGHCLELKSGTPPRGLQFTLKPENEAQKPSETIVMANLGYFQLKAAPGVWTLGLRDGPSRDIFSLETHNDKPVVVHSFQSIVIKVKVKRNPGKESVSLLETEEENSGKSNFVWRIYFQIWFGFGSKKPEVEEQVINVFSVASGHLYERLLRIMMLSVLKNTQSKVKFWFLKNYLSPTVKDLLPELAKQYGFEYELVHYHWPRWLNPQREKQRIIWGYKILFLDVLFPLSLKKIVFVDADQIVRTDLKELFELDLEGNPYGYTPFCDSRVEMEGFRFWKHGYWKSHLGKRKYHISALYVVDLVRFRRVAAGDRLRGQYQALSQDPNSLSNLDQDLPNNMIYQVGIKSLPQEWLWCETWCNEESKSKAKTIDLCNNPQTKEPKLEAAQRIVPEWKDYDRELREFIVKVQTKTAGQTSEDSEDRSVPESSSHDEHTEL